MKTIYSVFALLTCLIPTFAHANYGSPSLTERRVAQLINATRARHGLRNLVFDARMQTACQKHADNMAAQKRGSGDLDGFTVADRLLAAGYNYYYNGETIYWASRPGDSSPEGITNWLFKTEEHRNQALARRFANIGVGIRVGVDGMTYVCIDYGALGVNIDGN